jgi:ABC-2 type transport system permease protein
VDSPGDQAKLAEWMAAGQVRAVHSREVTLEEVFTDVAGTRSAESRKGEPMHPRMILAIARKDALDLWLDRSKFMVLLAPLLLGLLWLLISSLTGSGQPTPTPTMLLVYNPSQSSLPQFISSVLGDTQITEAASTAQVSAAFEAKSPQSYDVGLVIPADFEQQLRAGGQPQITLYLNGTHLDAQQRTNVQGIVLYYARSVATPRPPLSLVTEAINRNPQPVSTPPNLGTIYSIIMLPLSLIVGLSIMPGLVIEERERKTLRWLLVSPGTLSDILVGKALVTLAYQLVVSLGVMALLGGFGGAIPFLLLYILLGACLALALGLLFGMIFQTASAAGVVSGLSGFLFIIPAVIIPLAPFIGSNAITTLVKVLPTYYLADGANNAIQRVGSFSSNLLDVGVTLATTLVVFLIAVWMFRRQASAAGTI